MKKQSYSASIEADGSPRDVIKRINDVASWWTKDFKGEFSGQSTKINDEFIVRFGNVHYSKQKLVEVVPDKKIVWLVTDSEIKWIEKDKTEWTGTKMIFELVPKDDKTILHFTHEGLMPGKECYDKCIQGWDMLIRDKLFHLLSTQTQKV